MGMLKVKYSELFKVSVEQPFYSNSICPKYTTELRPDFEITPTAECTALMKRLDLLFKKDDHAGGFSVWASVAGTSGGNDLLKFKPRHSDVLTFFLSQRNPALSNFNDLPLDTAAKVYHFTNELIDPAAPRDDLHLSFDASGVKSGDLTKRVTGTYTYTSLVPVAPGTARVKHLVTGQEAQPKSLMTEAGKSYLLFDLSSFTPGSCQLVVSAVVTDEFYYTGITLDVPVFGIITLSLDTALQPNYRIIEVDGSITPQRPGYRLHFVNRQTWWRYRMILQTNSPLYLEMAALNPADRADFINRLNVISNDATILFNSNPVSDTVFEFISASPVSLREKYFSTTAGPNAALRLTLKRYLGDPRESEVRSTLPYPATDRIDASASPTIYSDILLTL
jgi:hypothetical protein